MRGKAKQRSKTTEVVVSHSLGEPAFADMHGVTITARRCTITQLHCHSNSRYQRYYSHRTGKKAEVQPEKVSCPRSSV